MFENDAHADNSIDRILMENMVKLCSETIDYLYNECTPIKSPYQSGSKVELEVYVEKISLDSTSDEDHIKAITQFTSKLQERAINDLDLIKIGGTEEEIIERGSDWCADVARVGCALFQVAGFPARIVYLVDTERAYSGHVIVEVYRANYWGAVDTLTNVIYCHPDGTPASSWELMNNSKLIEKHSSGETTPYTNIDQFRQVAISNYSILDWKKYDYTASKINEYYRSILEMSGQGWPGGLRWIHGESN